MYTIADLISVGFSAFAFGLQLSNLIWYFLVTRKK